MPVGVFIFAAAVIVVAVRRNARPACDQSSVNVDVVYDRQPDAVQILRGRAIRALV